MSHCPHCQQPAAPGIKFCGSCGASLPQVAGRRPAWRPILISLGALLLLGAAGFLYFLQATHEIVLWVEKMTPGAEQAVTVANRFFDQVNAGKLPEACDLNENGRDWCLKNEAEKLRQLTAEKLNAVYAWKENDSRGYATYTVVARGTTGKVYWLHIAPDSPKPPVITGPYEGRSYEQQLVKRLAK